MSVRHLNFTGRKRIAREHVKVAVGGVPPESQITASFNFADYGFPRAARVVLEAQAGWTVQRFEFGTVAESTPPSDTRLTEFSSMAGLLFRLKVVGVGDSEGRLLGEAERLRPSSTVEEANQRSFVIVRSLDLGQLAWKVSIDEGQPLLVVNSRLGDHHDFLRRKEVVGLVLPAVLQQVMAAAIDAGVDDEDPSAWESQAIRFGEDLADMSSPDPEDDEAVAIWIETVVAEFARRHRLLDGVLELLGGPDA